MVVIEATDRVGGRLFRQDYHPKKKEEKGEGEGKEKEKGKGKEGEKEEEREEEGGGGEVVSVDLGGQWIGPPQKYVTELAEELGMVTEEQYDIGGAILEVCVHLYIYLFIYKYFVLL